MRKSRKQTTIKEDTGKVLVDLGKLVFGSIVLGGVLSGEIPQSVLVISGIVVAVLLCSVGLWIAAKEKKSGENTDSTA